MVSISVRGLECVEGGIGTLVTGAENGLDIVT